MWGQRLMGHYASRLDDILNRGVAAVHGESSYRNGQAHPRFGDVSAHFLFGDTKQLDPVLDSALYRSACDDSVSRFGKAAFDATNFVISLDQLVRQNPDSDYGQIVQNLREGNATGDLAFWLSRCLMFLPTEERDTFNDNNTIHATCSNSEKNKINSRYMVGLSNVVIVESRCEGRHCSGLDDKKAGAAQKIPPVVYLSIDMMVKLTVNILPELGLYNNARGMVKDFYFVDAEGMIVPYDPENKRQSPVVIVDFPGYTGPPISDAMAAAGKATWVPIVATERRCDSQQHCCYRIGIPLVVAKADTIHSLQGSTIGDNKPIKRIVIHWSRQAESRWPNIFYVAATRAMGSHNLALSFSMTQDDLDNIGKGDRWRMQNDDANRLTRLASSFLQEKQAARAEPWHGDQEKRWGSAYDLRKKIMRFILRAETSCQPSIPGESEGRFGPVSQGIKDSILDCLRQWRASLEALTPIDV